MAGKMRSPNYPGLSLQQAIEAAEKLWKAEKRTSVSHETAVAALGYKMLSGPARVAIAAMRQYGLVDKAEKGHVRISDVAVSILHGDPNERAGALVSAALEPPLFAELHRTHADASENAIRSYLITKKRFAEDGARRAAKAFKESLTFASALKAGYTAPEGADTPEDMQGNEQGHNSGAAGAVKPPDGVFSLNVPFSKGSISVQVRVTGDAISPAHLARVRRYLELAEQEWNEGGS